MIKRPYQQYNSGRSKFGGDWEFPNADWRTRKTIGRPKRPMEGRCRMGGCMGASSRDELAGIIQGMTPQQAAETMINSYAAGRRTGLLTGIIVGVAGYWVVRRVIK